MSGPMGPVAAISGPMGPVAPVHSVDEWADIIRRDLGNAIDSIIRAGTHLMQAKHQLGKGPYGDMLKAVRLHERTARRLIAIAENRVLTNPEYHARLPVSMRTLSELAEIPAPMLEGYIKDGIVNVDMERSEVETLRKSKRRAAEATGEKPLSELERTKQALAQALQENHQLKERLKHDGSLFDLKLSPPKEIGRVIAAHCSETKWREIKKATDEAYKGKRQRPAG